jgi:hypothetical protein
LNNKRLRKKQKTLTNPPKKTYKTRQGWIIHKNSRGPKMDLVIGAEKTHGCDPVAYLKEKKRTFVVVDKNSNSPIIKKHNLQKVDKISGEGKFFVQGDVPKALALLEELKPEHVFATSPVHIVAEFAKTKFKLERWDEAISPILPYLPAGVIFRVGKGELVLSFNRDKDCIKNCEAPEVFTQEQLSKSCPVGRIRPCTMDQLMRYACPEGVILFSHSMMPGLGAFKGEEILEFFEWAKNKQKFVVGTSCNCHGVFWGFKRSEE